MTALDCHRPAVPSSMGNNQAYLKEEELVSLERLSRLSPAQSGMVTHQGNEVGEGETYGNVHSVLLVSHRPKLLPVALLRKQVLDQPLFLIQTPAAWGGSGKEQGLVTGPQKGSFAVVLLGQGRAEGS